MNLNYFIAKRLIRQGKNKNKVSSPIIKIAIISISIGVMIMLIAMATGFGLQHRIREKISAFSGHVVISVYDDNQSDLTLEPINVKQNFIKNIKKIEGVKSIQAYASIGGIIRTEKDFEGIIYKGVEKNYDWSLFKPYIIQGKIPNYHTKKRSDSVLISKTTADRLGLKLHDKFTTYFLKKNKRMPKLRVFKIAGIYNSGFEEFDKLYVLGDLRTVQGLYKWDDSLAGGFEVILNDFSLIDEKLTDISDNKPPTLNAVSIKEKFSMFFNWLKMFDFNILLILIIVIFIAGLNMVTTLLVIILEKRQFIAIMKVLGSNHKKLQHIFLIQASYIISIGLLIGNLLGLGMIFIQKYFGVIKLDPENYYVKTAPVYIELKHILLLNLGVLIAILAMLLIPVLLVSKISPVKVLKYD